MESFSVVDSCLSQCCPRNLLGPPLHDRHLAALQVSRRQRGWPRISARGAHAWMWKGPDHLTVVLSSMIFACSQGVRIVGESQLSWGANFAKSCHMELASRYEEPPWLVPAAACCRKLHFELNHECCCLTGPLKATCGETRQQTYSGALRMPWTCLKRGTRGVPPQQPLGVTNNEFLVQMSTRFSLAFTRKNS